MWVTNTLPLYNCTEGSPSPCRQSHVVRFPGGRVKSIEMYPYTRSTRSQTLTVVQHTIFDVQASKRLFYTCNSVVLFNIIIIIAVGVSAHAVVGSLAWIRMRRATCTRWARWSLEDVLNMPEQFDSRSQPLSLSVSEISKTNNKLVPTQITNAKWSLMKNDNKRQVKVRRKYFLSPSLIKQSLLGRLCLGVHFDVCHICWDCTCAMLSRPECRNGLN